MKLFDWTADAQIGDVCLLHAGPDTIAILRVPPAFYCINLSTRSAWPSKLSDLFGPAYFATDEEVHPALFVIKQPTEASETKGGTAG